MGVMICLYGNLQELVGTRELELDVDSDSRHSLLELITLISDLYGPEFRKAVVDKAGTKFRVACLVNGRPVCDIRTGVSEGDIVSFMPILAGG